ncbi:MAG: hypothetical protein DCC88_00660 [Spirobacillus cienkowskii]|jgi:hypothetical protein|uniref:Uncharacterized protein n=1 Tax=Spirobacillus cienkowskii TaxID=495820 RepID=A0A369KU97_9BACT|nr:MAG: hypothetical protein DCC88_00660 [Spirobacillus cienkowskii]
MNHFYLLITLGLLIIQNNTFAVSIISWWNYLKENEIAILERECSVKISLDEYYSSKEFLRKVKKFDYSVAIFGNALYDLVESKIENTANIFRSSINQYHPNVAKAFKKQKYSKKTAIGNITTSGFLFNANTVYLNETDSINKIFAKAKGKNVAIMDEPLEALKLVSQYNNNGEIDVSEASIIAFQNLVSETQTIIADDILHVVKDKKFAFAYSWSGIAFKRFFDYPDLNLKFILHPQVSYYTYDLIAPLNNNKDTFCVAKKLAEKNIIDIFVNRQHYYSPYGMPTKVNAMMEGYHNDFIETFPQFKLLEVNNKNQIKIINLWEKMILSLKIK